MEKSELVSAKNVPETLAEQIFAGEYANRSLGSEGIEVGDKITLVALPEKLSEFKPAKKPGDTEEPTAQPYVNLVTKGDRASMSLGSLVGTVKRQKYFADEYAPEWLDGKKQLDDAVEFPHRVPDAVAFVGEHIGTTYQCIAKVENSGKNNDRTFYLWKEVK